MPPKKIIDPVKEYLVKRDEKTTKAKIAEVKSAQTEISKSRKSIPTSAASVLKGIKRREKSSIPKNDDEIYRNWLMSNIYTLTLGDSFNQNAFKTKLTTYFVEPSGATVGKILQQLNPIIAAKIIKDALVQNDLTIYEYVFNQLNDKQQEEMETIYESLLKEYRKDISETGEIITLKPDAIKSAQSQLDYLLKMRAGEENIMKRRELKTRVIQKEVNIPKYREKIVEIAPGVSYSTYEKAGTEKHIIKQTIYDKGEVIFDDDLNPILPEGPVEIEYIPVDLSGKPMDTRYINLNCVTLYRNRPWIDNFRFSYIGNIDGESLNMDYCDKDDIIEYEGKNYYKVNFAFLVAQCNKFAHNRNQEGNVFTFYDNISVSNVPVPVRVELLHTTFSNDGENLYIQNEEIFAMEKKWLSETSAGIEYKINKFAKKLVPNSENVLFDVVGNINFREWIASVINRGLEKISVSYPFIPYSGNSKDIMNLIDEAVKLNFDKELEDFAQSLARVLTVFDVNGLGLYTTALREKIRVGIFKPVDILYMNNETIFQDLWSGLSESGISQFIVIATNETYKERYRIITFMYRLNNPFEKIPDKFESILSLEMPKTFIPQRIVCNEGIDNSYLTLYYTEDDNVICLDLLQTIDNIEKGDFTYNNGKTVINLRESFVDYVKRIDKQKARDLALVTLNKNLSNEQLRDIISKSSFLFQLYNNIGSIKSKFIEEAPKEPDVSKVSDPVKKSEIIKKNKDEKCAFCNKLLNKNAYKTYLFNIGNQELSKTCTDLSCSGIYFCGAKCMGEYKVPSDSDITGKLKNLLSGASVVEETVVEEKVPEIEVVTVSTKETIPPPTSQEMSDEDLELLAEFEKELSEKAAKEDEMSDSEIAAYEPKEEEDEMSDSEIAAYEPEPSTQPQNESILSKITKKVKKIVDSDSEDE